jgi:GcrA cell cycle regulator
MGEWSQAEIKTLQTMWSDGATATTIAAALGPTFTRGSVLGKVHRLGLKREKTAPSNARPAAKGAAPASRPAAAKTLEARPRATEGTSARDTSGPMPIWALGQCQCRWPMGDLLDPPVLFCAAATEEGSPWCPIHEQLVYTSTVRPRSEAPPPREPRLARLAAAGVRARF